MPRAHFAAPSNHFAAPGGYFAMSRARFTATRGNLAEPSVGSVEPRACLAELSVNPAKRAPPRSRWKSRTDLRREEHAAHVLHQSRRQVIYEGAIDSKATPNPTDIANSAKYVKVALDAQLTSVRLLGEIQIITGAP